MSAVLTILFDDDEKRKKLLTHGKRMTTATSLTQKQREREATDRASPNLEFRGGIRISLSDTSHRDDDIAVSSWHCVFIVFRCSPSA
ncbi:hypothetical protein PHSY_001621 [Pseudozyma hubeiensis SY62]|uniref:Uncharacterized protein n=1 Tax=Pseudozyma hubeiensis (strain SY62) TaxID=1305764 RepID=R9NZC3_PSEHS|nr:hypothetical protein PHSY_001621 [Pseudozyma hubeiensis SY62]GAC94052.1 hypothetical protein PHSY_001621 [Pseudozyma hubeiensis SY62]